MTGDWRDEFEPGPDDPHDREESNGDGSAIAFISAAGAIIATVWIVAGVAEFAPILDHWWSFPLLLTTAVVSFVLSLAGLAAALELMVKKS